MSSFAEGASDEYVQAQLAGLTTYEIKAKEFYYHRSCQRDIYRIHNKDTNTSAEHNIREECFANLLKHVRSSMIERGQFSTITKLSSYYEKLQTEQNIPVKGVANKDVKRRLKIEFGDDLMFYQKNKRQSEFVYHRSVPIEEDDRSWFFMNIEEKVMKVAKMFRTQIEESMETFKKWPPHPDEILSENVSIPNLLHIFLKSLLSKNFPVSQRVERLSKSIGQDIIYNQSNGKIKTVKHVQLGIITKKRTGSRFLIDSLNRLGHSISYDEVSNIETYFAELQANNQSHRSFVPNNIQPSTFITFVFDNCDHNPETLSGISMHCTNGIIIQKPVSTNEPPRPDSVQSNDTIRPRRRSFIPIVNETQNYYPPPKRVNPGSLRSIDIDTNLIHGVISKKADFLWTLARYQSTTVTPDSQKIPGWTGFHHQVMKLPMPEPISKVYYLPSIDQSPTKMSTVQEVLLQVKAKAEALNNREADLVFDHAIYCKALEILMDPRNLELRNFINLRMGAFHTSCIFIAVIGKRFSAAGLKDICIEATLVGTGSADSIMKGKQYNRGVRAFKIVYEALQRLKLDAFAEWLVKEPNNAVLVNFLESTELSNLISNADPDTFKTSMDAIEELFSLFQLFEERIVCSELGPMSKFWNSFIVSCELANRIFIPCHRDMDHTLPGAVFIFLFAISPLLFHRTFFTE